ncbi:DUF302 domain-containing protein [Maritimibacter fusiformis]|uniref:DUF302 domain-containing protein n=1 Tax=Maritimibacter fusiformis TaxID=2603819 RepID=A0A5D0RSD7_9RHOB|nr:DUF302 domain-containing protein [Maritimibacter fusiformis]TYB83558.1 DUF302 domain-containing protein [Maritimibacter fusiformis]
MTWIIRLLALVGVLALGAGLWIGPDLWRYKTALDGFDDQAWATYKGLADRLADTGNAAAATVWTVKVADGLSFEEVDESIKAVAIDRNIRGVGELPLGDQVAAMNGTPWRKLNIYLYCNPLTAARMIEHHIAYAAYLPCRVSLVEDAAGDLWITSLDMDMMIHGGRELPPELKAEALAVKDIILDIMNRAAEGDF